MEIKELSSIMESSAMSLNNVHFVNMQNLFRQHLKHNSSTNFINTNVIRVMIEVLFYKSPSRIDQLSEKRGLHLTMDGIHLNSKGADIVAQQYTSIIEQYMIEKETGGR
jgi:hypothetical protein